MNITTPCLLNSCNDIAPGGKDHPTGSRIDYAYTKN